MSNPQKKPPSRTSALSEQAQRLPNIPDVPVVQDVERDERLRRILVLWGSGATEAQVRKSVIREFAVTPEQVSRDLGDLRDELRSRLDDEGAIDLVMYGAAARANDVVDRFHRLAVEPLPDHVLQVPSENPDNPMGPGAVWRPLTPAEQASLINAKAAAARVAIHALDFQTKLLGRRSQRWADKPSNVIQIAVGKDGLTEQEAELLRTLGMVN
jgi:hypothetical protein